MREVSAIPAMPFSYFYWHRAGRGLCVRGKGFSASAGSARRGDTAATQAPALLPPSQADIQPWPKELLKPQLLQPICEKKKKKIKSQPAKSKLNPQNLQIFSPQAPHTQRESKPGGRCSTTFLLKVPKQTGKGELSEPSPRALSKGK